MTSALFVHDMVGQFAEVASLGLFPAILLLLGAVLTGFALGVFGLLSIGGLLAALTRPKL